VGRIEGLAWSRTQKLFVEDLIERNVECVRPFFERVEDRVQWPFSTREYKSGKNQFALEDRPDSGSALCGVP
jgi:hypothetical protein